MGSVVEPGRLALRAIGLAKLGLLLAVVLLPVAVSAQEAGGQDQTGQPTAEVVVDGRTLFRVRGVSAFPAEQRARQIADQIGLIAHDPAVRAADLRVVEETDRSRILVGDTPVASVYDADAVLEGVNRQVLARVFRDEIAEAIDAFRRERQPRALLVNSGYAAGATLLLFVLLFATVQISRLLSKWLKRSYDSRAHRLRIQDFQLVQTEKLWTSLGTAGAMVRTVLVVAMILLYVEFVLGLYPWTRQISRWLLAIALDPLRTIGAGMVRAVPDLVFLGILFMLVLYGLRLARIFFEAIGNGSIRFPGFDADWAIPTFGMLRVLVISFAAVVAYPYVPGSQTLAFKSVTVFLGVVLSLGSSSAVANIIAGYSLIYRRAFKVGHRVRIGDDLGDVTDVGLQVTRLRSLKNEEIVIPNSNILNTHVVNYSVLAQQRGLILHTTVGIGYETPWRQVEAMLLQAAERTPGLRAEPPPFVLHKVLADFAVTYELNVYTDQPLRQPQLYTELHRNILDMFNEYGVQIMTPAYEGDPAEPKVVPKEKWFESPAQHTGGLAE